MVHLVDDVQIDTEVIVDDGRHRLSATSAAFHEKYPEEDIVVIVKSVTYGEVDNFERYNNDSYAKYALGNDTFAYMPKDLLARIKKEYPKEVDRLIQDILGDVAAKETVRVLMQDEFGNTIFPLRVNKRNEDLRLAEQNPAGDYIYDYKKNAEIKVDGEIYYRVIPIGHEDSEFEFLQEYIPKEEILKRLIKKELPFGIMGDYLPKSIFDKFHRLVEEKKKEYYQELLDKIKTPPLVNLAFDEKSFAHYPNSWYPHLDMRHLYSASFLGDCERVLESLYCPDCIDSGVKFDDFDNVIFVPQTRSGTTYAYDIALGLHLGEWIEFKNAGYYSSNPYENIASEDLLMTFKNPEDAWNWYQGYFYDIEEMDASKEDFMLNEDYLKSLDARKEKAYLQTIPLDFRNAPKEMREKLVEAYKNRLFKYDDVILSNAKNISAVLKSGEYSIKIYSEQHNIPHIIGRNGRNIKEISDDLKKRFIIAERAKVEDVKKIVSHKNPRHLDDYLAIALLKNKAPDAQIEYLQPQNIPDEYLRDTKIALVDVGGDFNPIKFNYDHHQNVYAYPSSVILVLADIYKKTEIHSEALAIVDYIDRYGYSKAATKFNLKSSDEVQEKLKTLLMADLNDYDVCKIIADLTLESVDKKNISYNDFIVALFERLKEAHKLDRAIKQIEKEKAEFKRKLDKALSINSGGVDVVISKESFAPFHKKAFEHFDADIIIERNAMNPNQTSIIKNTTKESAKNIDLEKIFNLHPKVFLHGTGFIAVIDTSIDDIEINAVYEIVDEVTKKKQAKKQRNGLVVKRS